MNTKYQQKADSSLGYRKIGLIIFLIVSFCFSLTTTYAQQDIGPPTDTTRFTEENRRDLRLKKLDMQQEFNKIKQNYNKDSAQVGIHTQTNKLYLFTNLFSSGNDGRELIDFSNQTDNAQIIADTIALIFRLIFTVSATIIVISLTYNSVGYLVQILQGNSVGMAKFLKDIGNKILGLVVLLLSYLILNLVNPSLINFDVFQAQAPVPIKTTVV